MTVPCISCNMFASDEFYNGASEYLRLKDCYKFKICLP